MLVEHLLIGLQVMPVHYQVLLPQLLLEVEVEELTPLTVQLHLVDPILVLKVEVVMKTPLSQVQILVLYSE